MKHAEMRRAHTGIPEHRIKPILLATFNDLEQVAHQRALRPVEYRAAGRPVIGHAVGPAHSLNRIENPGGTEVFVNFGATVEAAKANKNPQMILFHRDSDDVKDPTTHVIFSVKDMTSAVTALKAAGGTMTGEPRPFRSSGIVLGFAVDPAGNRIELIQRP